MTMLEKLVKHILIVDRLLLAYNKRPVEFAAACDEVIDPTGNLLGWIRDLAMELKENKS